VEEVILEIETPSSGFKYWKKAIGRLTVCSRDRIECIQQAALRGMVLCNGRDRTPIKPMQH
jgi:hypothetical protein